MQEGGMHWQHPTHCDSVTDFIASDRWWATKPPSFICIVASFDVINNAKGWHALAASFLSLWWNEIEMS
jgi:hypothetical protein